MLEWENKRDYARLRSLIWSLGALVAGFFGQKMDPPSKEELEDEKRDETPESELV